MLAGPLAAQEAGRSAPAQPESAHDTRLLTGCLVAGPDEAVFKLTNASPVPPVPPVPADAAAAGGATKQQAMEYELLAAKRLDTTSVAPIDMKPFVGHRVEITARPAAPAAPPHEPPRADGEPKQQPETVSSPEKHVVERLMVTAIKQVVGTCQEK
jgi:hypothetical protein